MSPVEYQVAIYVGILDHGEIELDAEKVRETACRLFPSARQPADSLVCEFLLRETRKHLVFLRDPCVQKPPSIRRLLKWLLMSPAGTNRRGRRFFEDMENVRRTYLPKKSVARGAGSTLGCTGEMEAEGGPSRKAELFSASVTGGAD